MPLMDQYTNPYTPGAGNQPPALTGRDSEIEQFKVLLGRLERGRYKKSMAIHGLRGVGKTVLLRKFEGLATQSGWASAFKEMQTDTELRPLISLMTYKLIRQLSRKKKAAAKIKQIMSVHASFSVSADAEGRVTASFDVKPAGGVADSGDFETDLAELFTELGETAKAAGAGAVFLLDELQLLGKRDLEALIAAIHQTGQMDPPLPVTVVGAGLPTLPNHLVKAKTYAERLFAFPEIGKLNDQAARDAIVIPASQENVEYTDKAVKSILKQSEGYPYFLQEWGEKVWSTATDSPITDDDVRLALPLVRQELDDELFAVRLDRATPNEKRYLAAIAELGDGSQATPDVAQSIGYSTTTASPIRRALIDKGLIYCPRYGLVDFTVPHFADYMRRQHISVVDS